MHIHKRIIAIVISFCLLIAGIPVSSLDSTFLAPPGESELGSKLFFREYLKPTKLCDSDNPDIKKRSHKLTKTLRSSSKKADLLWNYIKRNMYFGIGYGAYYNATASETLNEIKKKTSTMKYGTWFNWANVLVAMARSIGIPARYSVIQVKKEAFEYLFAPEQFKAMKKTIPYIRAELFVDGKWKKYDVFIDPQYIVSGTEYHTANIDKLAETHAKRKTRKQWNDLEKQRRKSIVNKGGKEDIPVFQIERGNIILKVIADLTEQGIRSSIEKVKEAIDHLSKKNSLVEKLNYTQIRLTRDYWGIKDLISQRINFEALIPKIKKITSEYKKPHGEKPFPAETCRLFNEQYPDQSILYATFNRWLKNNNKYKTLGIAEPKKGIDILVKQITIEVEKKRKGRHKNNLILSQLCNYDDPDMMRQAVTLTKDIDSDTAKAYELWQWIKKYMHFGIGKGGYYDAPASESFKNIVNKKSKNKCGRSFNWANMLLAMARSIGIPARYCVRQVKKEAFEHLYAPAQFKKMDDTVEYISAELLVDGRWKKYDIFRNHEFDVPESLQRISNIDKFALTKAKEKTRDKCDISERTRRKHMVALGADETLSLLWLERGNMLRKIISDLIKQKKRARAGLITEEMARQAKKDSEIKALSYDQIINIAKVVGLSSTISHRVASEKRKARIKEITSNVKKEQKRIKQKAKGPSADETVALYNKEYDDDSLTYQSLLKWMSTNNITFKELGMAKAERGKEHSLAKIINAAKKAAGEGLANPVTYKDIKIAMGTKSAAFANRLRRLRNAGVNVEEEIIKAGVRLVRKDIESKLDKLKEMQITADTDIMELKIVKEIKQMIKDVKRRGDKKYAEILTKELDKVIVRKNKEKQKLMDMVKKIDDKLVQLEQFEISEETTGRSVVNSKLAQGILKLLKKYRKKLRYPNREIDMRIKFNKVMEELKSAIYTTKSDIQSINNMLKELKIMDVKPGTDILKTKIVKRINTKIAGLDKAKRNIVEQLKKERDTVIANKKREPLLIEEIQGKLGEIKRMKINQGVILGKVPPVALIEKKIMVLRENGSTKTANKLQIKLYDILMKEEFKILNQAEVGIDTALEDFIENDNINKMILNLRRAGEKKKANGLRKRFTEIFGPLKRKVKKIKTYTRYITSQLDILRDRKIKPGTSLEDLKIVKNIEDKIIEIKKINADLGLLYEEELKKVKESKYNDVRIAEIKEKLEKLRGTKVTAETDLKSVAIVIAIKQLIRDVKKKGDPQSAEKFTEEFNQITEQKKEKILKLIRISKEKEQKISRMEKEELIRNIKKELKNLSKTAIWADTELANISEIASIKQGINRLRQIEEKEKADEFESSLDEIIGNLKEKILDIIDKVNTIELNLVKIKNEDIEPGTSVDGLTIIKETSEMIAKLKKSNVKIVLAFEEKLKAAIESKYNEITVAEIVDKLNALSDVEVSAETNVDKLMRDSKIPSMIKSLRKKGLYATADEFEKELNLTVAAKRNAVLKAKKEKREEKRKKPEKQLKQKVVKAKPPEPEKPKAIKKRRVDIDRVRRIVNKFLKSEGRDEATTGELIAAFKFLGENIDAILNQNLLLAIKAGKIIRKLRSIVPDEVRKEVDLYQKKRTEKQISASN